MPNKDFVGGSPENQYNFSTELLQLIQKHSLEEDSDTPAIVLVGYIIGCLKAFNLSVTLSAALIDTRENIAKIRTFGK